MPDPQRFAERTALVTGGSRGIGRATCLTLADQGARVAINYRQDEGAARDTLDQIASSGSQAMIVQADVSREDEVASMVEAVREQLGPIELLVNNAGIATSVSHEEFTFVDWKRMFEVNVDGPFLTTWAVKDEMIAAGFGRIVNVSSLASALLKENLIHYATTKAAVNAFTRQCSAALARHNIRVNCVAPGLTDTDLASGANPDMIEGLIAATALGRMAEPGEIASVITFLLSEEAGYVTGQTIMACGGRS
tara:strand:- start:192 stop:944 length:753 start_codon:yes stop_codon:yes gene_type:complete